MNYDLFALWDDSTSKYEGSDNHAHIKYLLTIDKQSGKKTHQSLVNKYQIRPMDAYCLSTDITTFPNFSFLLTFKFELATPYLSKDDEDFHICDNPVRKDKVFKVPMVSGSSWKGNMRWTAMKLYTDKLPENIPDDVALNKALEERAKLVRLFGNEKDKMDNYLNEQIAKPISGNFYEEIAKAAPKTKSEETDFEAKKKYISQKFAKLLKEKKYISDSMDGRRGRLNFYPTFFDKIGLEVINPHDRKTKAGTLPIYIESVPEGAKGTFSLLYLPFDLIGKSDPKEEVCNDLELMFDALKAMMLTYGFSAKKSSGFGLIRNNISGAFEMAGYPLEKKDGDARKAQVDSSNPFAKLAKLNIVSGEKPKDREFSKFAGLKGLINKVKDAINNDTVKRG